MFTQFEEKGKLFTNVVAKKPVTVHIQTVTNIIEGIIHIRPDIRLKDEINQTEAFLAITDAKVFDLDKKHIRDCKFLAINRTQIVWLTPENDNTTQEKNE